MFSRTECGFLAAGNLAVAALYLSRGHCVCAVWAFATAAMCAYLAVVKRSK